MPRLITGWELHVLPKFLDGKVHLPCNVYHYHPISRYLGQCHILIHVLQLEIAYKPIEVFFSYTEFNLGYGSYNSSHL